jgi:hypothetical protein
VQKPFIGAGYTGAQGMPALNSIPQFIMYLTPGGWHTILQVAVAPAIALPPFSVLPSCWLNSPGLSYAVPASRVLPAPLCQQACNIRTDTIQGHRLS